MRHKYSKKVNICIAPTVIAGLPKKYNEKITILAAGFESNNNGIFAYVELDSENDVFAKEILKHLEDNKGLKIQL